MKNSVTSFYLLSYMLFNYGQNKMSVGAMMVHIMTQIILMTALSRECTILANTPQLKEWLKPMKGKINNSFTSLSFDQVTIKSKKGIFLSVSPLFEAYDVDNTIQMVRCCNSHFIVTSTF